jgi:hypothetical protein
VHLTQKQKLSADKEHLIVDWSLEEADHGFPLSLKDIEKFANAIIEHQNRPKYKPVGKNWINRLLETP